MLGHRLRRWPNIIKTSGSVSCLLSFTLGKHFTLSQLDADPRFELRIWRWPKIEALSWSSCRPTHVTVCSQLSGNMWLHNIYLTAFSDLDFITSLQFSCVRNLQETEYPAMIKKISSKTRTDYCFRKIWLSELDVAMDHILYWINHWMRLYFVQLSGPYMYKLYWAKCKCPPETGYELGALTAWGWARYVSVMIDWKTALSLHMDRCHCWRSVRSGRLATILTLWPPSYIIGISTHLRLCLADAIHNFKRLKIVHIWQNGRQQFWNRVDWCHFFSLTNENEMKWIGL